jgi:hypothetical protein
MSVGLRPWRTAKVGRDNLSIREQSQARASAVQIGSARCALKSPLRIYFRNPAFRGQFNDSCHEGDVLTFIGDYEPSPRSCSIESKNCYYGPVPIKTAETSAAPAPVNRYAVGSAPYQGRRNREKLRDGPTTL